MFDILQVTDPGCCGMRRIDEDGCCVGCGRDFFDPDTGAERGDGTRVPNACLSDAALEMLDALEAIQECTAPHGTLLDYDQPCPECSAKVTAAIAKAKGE